MINVKRDIQCKQTEIPAVIITLSPDVVCCNCTA